MLVQYIDLRKILLVTLLSCPNFSDPLISYAIFPTCARERQKESQLVIRASQWSSDPRVLV